MLYPSIDYLMKKADSKYSLVVLTSKRARQLLDSGEITQIKPHSNKYVGIALEEIARDILTIPSQVQKNNGNDDTPICNT